MIEQKPVVAKPPAQPGRSNLVLVTLGCFLTYAILSGMISQIGTLSAAIALQFDQPLTSATARFTFLNLGITAGAVLSLVAFEFLSLKRAFLVCYSLFAAALAAICLANQWASLPVLLLLVGSAGNLGLNAAAVTLALNYTERKRAAILLCTDVCFAGAGIVAAPGAATLSANGYPWYASFWVLCAAAGLVTVIAIFGRFPQTARQQNISLGKQNWPKAIGFYFAGLTCYLFAQISMLLWLPNYLSDSLGASAAQAAGAVGNYWSGMAIGQIILVIALLRCPAQWLLTAIVVSSVVVAGGLLLLNTPQQFAMAAVALGLANAGILKLTIAAGASLLAHPQRVVTLFLFAGACGQVLSPLVSSKVVASYGLFSGLVLMAVFMALAALAILIAQFSTRASVRLNEQDGGHKVAARTEKSREENYVPSSSTH